MIYGMGGTITSPIGTFGAAKQAEAIINNVQPMSSAVVGFVPPNTQDSDPISLQITIGTSNFDASYVEQLVQGGDIAAITNLLANAGYSSVQNPNVTASTPITIRDIPVVHTTTPITSVTPLPAPINTTVSTGAATGNIVTQTSASPTPASTTTQTMSDILSGSVFGGVSNGVLLVAAIGLAVILFMPSQHGRR